MEAGSVDEVDDTFFVVGWRGRYYYFFSGGTGHRIRGDSLHRMVVLLPLAHRTKSLADILNRDYNNPTGNAPHWDHVQPSQAHDDRRDIRNPTHMSLSRFPSHLAGLVSHYATVSSSLSVPGGAMDDLSSSRLACIRSSACRSVTYTRVPPGP